SQHRSQSDDRSRRRSRQAESRDRISRRYTVEVVVPDLGDFADVEVIEVLVKPGDSVAAEQGLITLETDKATMDIPSPAAGKITALKVKTGDRVSAGTVIATLDPADAKASAPPAAAGARSDDEPTLQRPPASRGSSRFRTWATSRASRSSKYS